MASWTMRRRMLAVIRGQPHERVPFVQYDNLAAPSAEVRAALGADALGVMRWSHVFRIEHPGCSFESKDIARDGKRGQRTVLHTPEGDLVEEKFFEITFGTAHIDRHFVQEPGDYRALNAYLRAAVVIEDLERFLRDEREIGEGGFPFVSLGRTPYQQLWIEWTGLENLSLHLADAPGAVEETARLMAQVQRRGFEAVRAAVRKVDVPFVNFGDNITAPAIGEANFRKYCVPQYNRMAEMLEGTGVPVAVHMDGSLRPLWKAIGESRVECLDSLSPPPDNDTSAAQAAAMWPRMRLLLNFPSSVHLAQAAEVRRRARQILDEVGRAEAGRMWIQISENVPPGAWRRSFPEIVGAIEDFGAPGGEV